MAAEWPGIADAEVGQTYARDGPDDADQYRLQSKRQTDAGTWVVSGRWEVSNA